MEKRISVRGKASLVLVLAIMLFTYGTFNAFATPPTSQYSPGAILDPACVPGSTNCSVKVLYDLYAENSTGTFLAAAPLATGDNAVAIGDGANASGDHAFAFGLGVIASGDYSMAFGDNTNATNDDAVAMGTGSTASGDTAFAIGNVTNASGDFSFAIGNGASASDINAVAIGGSNTAFSLAGPTASGENSFAVGPGSVASAFGSIAFVGGQAVGNQSVAIGQTTAAGLLSFSMGGGTAPDAQGDYSFFFGNGGSAIGNEAVTFSGNSDGDYSFSVFGSATGEGAVAMGTDDVGLSLSAPLASGDHSFAVNSGSVASGDLATAFGVTTASGLASMSWGDNTNASNQGATAFGSETTASGQSAVAWGFQTDATNTRATVWGDNTLASGIRATAFGYNTTASGDTATAFGQFTHATGAFSIAMGNNGTAAGNRSVSIGDFAMAPSFHETAMGNYTTNYTPAGGATIENTGDRLFTIGDGTGLGVESDAFTILKNGQIGIAIDNFEAVAGDNVGSPLQVGDGTSATALAYVNPLTGAWTTVSDERKKENITDLPYNLDTVLNLRPVSFDYKRNGAHTIGFLAQQVLPIVPEAVAGTEENGYGMSYSTLVPVLVKAIQDLNEKINLISAGTTTGAVFGDVVVNTLHAQSIDTQQFCMGGVCISAEQFSNLLDSAGITTTPDPDPILDPVPTSEPDPIPDPGSEPLLEPTI